MATPSDAGQSLGLTKSEMAFELLYSFEILSGATLISDLQYILNPGFTSADAALVGSLRLSINL